MNSNSTLYWSSLDTYENCPRKFLWARGWNMEDLGGGAGFPKPPPKKESRHHPIMGQVIEAGVTKFYNSELWRDPPNVTDALMSFLDDEWFRQLKDPRNYVNWERAGMSPTEMLEVCREGVQGYLRTMKAHSLLGVYARAEVDLVGWIDKWNPVGGRADVIIRREDTGISITDGKNSQRRERANPDQIRWYALLFKLSYRELPDRVGFVWYRYPYGAPAKDADGNQIFDDDGNPQIEQGLEWVPFTEDDLRGLAQRAVDAKKAMRKEKFDPNPIPKYCKYCVYESVCDARQAQRATNAEKRGQSKKLEEMEDAEGFSDFSL